MLYCADWQGWADEGSSLCMHDRAPLHPHILCLFLFPELQTTTGTAAVQKTVLQFAFCCDFPRRASHVRAPQMLCESPPGLAVFVPELLALCQPREELAVPASLFTDKEPALLMLLSIKRNWGVHSVLQKLILHAKAQQLRMDTENN